MVFHWNSWFDGMIYNNDARNYPLQTFLQTIIVQQDFSQITDAETLRNLSRLMMSSREKLPDNMDGSIERGYAGQSIFFENNQFTKNLTRIKDYARLISSVGINAVSINNVNVHSICR